MLYSFLADKQGKITPKKFGFLLCSMKDAEMPGSISQKGAEKAGGEFLMV